MINQSFGHAVEDFGDFLVSQGCCRSVNWVFRDGVTQYRRRWLISVNATESGKDATNARAIYEKGRRRGFGVCFEAIGEAGGVTYAYVNVPEDEGAAEAAMMTGELRFSVVADGAIVKLTQQNWLFGATRLMDRLRGGGTLIQEVPPRSQAADILTSGTT